MRLFIIDNGLVEKTAHHYNIALGFQSEARRRGIDVRFFVNRDADQDAVSALDARPVFTFRPNRRVSQDPLSGPLEDLLHLGGRFAAECSALVEDGVTKDDVVLLPTAAQNEIHGLAHWLKGLPEAQTPVVFMNFMEQNFLDAATRQPNFVAPLYRFAAKELAAAPDKRLFFTANSGAMAKLLGKLTLRRVFEYPMPHNYDFLEEQAKSAGAVKRDGGVLISVLGFSYVMKGFLLLPQIARRCVEANSDLSFYIQISHEFTNPKWNKAVAEMRAIPNVQLHSGPLSTAEFAQQLLHSDVILLPYDHRAYGAKTSGIFAEAVAFGKVTVVPEGTWMAANLENGRGAGTAFGDYSPQSIAAAVGAAVDKLDELRAKAEERADAWRREQSVAAFLDRMQSQLGA